MTQAAHKKPLPVSKQAALTRLRGVGPALAEKLGRLNVYKPEDLLFILPLRYEDRTHITPIGALRPGDRAVIEAEIELTEVAYRGRRTLMCRIFDGSAALTLRFFYFSRAQQQGLARGKRVRCYGEVRKGSAGLEIVHPEYRLITDASAPLADHLTPIYPSTEGVQQGRLRNLINQVLDEQLGSNKTSTANGFTDWLPASLLQDQNLPTLQEAVRYLHRPPANAKLAELSAGRHPAQQRLAMEEILAHHLSLRQIRQRAERLKAGAMLIPKSNNNSGNNLTKQLLNNLTFTLTGDQHKALEVILADLAKAHPMMRLLQGDVGCGKTVVAAAAALHAVSAGYQAVIMAPTELLAEQHRDNLQNWLKPLGVELAWLSGTLKGKQRNQAYAAIASGEAQIIVGTHAVFQAAVEYQQLGLVIVDEQHRFGVHQRLSLMEKGASGVHRPHQLVMTATPIPRTLAMTMYADLDVSVIREMPPGRQAIQTVALPDTRRGDVVTRVRAACTQGQRAYWVCPLIGESEVLDFQDAESTFTMLTEALKGIRVGLIHGRMRTDEKEQLMKAFSAGDIQVLVATTVIEVGVDVPEATLMIIENSERMGLAQLHQLRGRVGRGAEKSTCVLLYRGPLSNDATERLGVMRETGDGFVIAQKDLELRGPGEVLGKRQTGLMQMRVADLIRDAGLLPHIQDVAQQLLRDHPDAVTGIMHRWIGTAGEYGNV
ncbi:MAG: ATP-dependent DNA helicase RecG [Gammaproteobacteria bacterium]|nr:ATP-dependent DNA helicase RecG [Gammaproteobacteria bacterium]MCP4089931.1 ATP-dependent DNA helicase RecG [Gammaproteobacteria bacterium]MCP4276262.1 ATP-dependent DNA helicase RecG [Gammaproteobacteria bacterium]MCP4831257.1 ATP-dependent DNA helicase RecG [Gammaproteobacteria bacterium]MCP4928740.1 ATP-dependent DNA helicase RecG [Gammaproteobacteria bacterium]